jgi:hypothetical protein
VFGCKCNHSQQQKGKNHDEQMTQTSGIRPIGSEQLPNAQVGIASSAEARVGNQNFRKRATNEPFIPLFIAVVVRIPRDSGLGLGSRFRVLEFLNDASARPICGKSGTQVN